MVLVRISLRLTKKFPALANGILHLLLKHDRIDEAFVRENTVFKRGVEDVKTIGYGCYGEQAERYAFQDEARDSSLAELQEACTAIATHELVGVEIAEFQEAWSAGGPPVSALPLVQAVTPLLDVLGRRW